MTTTRDNPPTYCQYCTARCDQSFSGLTPTRAIVLYPSEPAIVSESIEQTVRQLRLAHGHATWLSWKDFNVPGQIVFCAICKQMRFTGLIVADVTTLNFNLLFEIGYAIGLGIPVIPIRDTSYIRDRADFNLLGMIDTLGYLDFSNSGELYEKLNGITVPDPIPEPTVDLNFAAPLYVVKGPQETDGELRLLALIKKSAVSFRTFDIKETPRVSLLEAYKQVVASLAVVAHVIDPNRTNAKVHNARCALIAGIAMALQKSVLMLQEGNWSQPIDYRDVVHTYTTPQQITRPTEDLCRRVIREFQDTKLRSLRAPQNLLQKLDLGDLAAENEIKGLHYYFVETGQYYSALKGHARLVVGRKGSGKTAIFYSVRDAVSRGHSTITVDLKPEGHQFTRLREQVLAHFTPGFQEHTLTAFWTAILVAELAHRIVEREYSWARNDPTRKLRYDSVVGVYAPIRTSDESDFSERLLRAVDRVSSVADRLRSSGQLERLTEEVFGEQVRTIANAVSDYLSDKEAVWVLIDNLDKGWPTLGASSQDVMILRCLLEAARKLQREMEHREVDFHCLVFLRNDIYDHLIKDTPDKGKDSTITLDWSDSEIFKKIFHQRVASSGLLEGDFETTWGAVFDATVGAQRSFDFILERTLLRPRDFLLFVQRAIETSINRGHERVKEEDLLQAEKSYSEDMFQATVFELHDVFPAYPDLLYSFLEAPVRFGEAQAHESLLKGGVESHDLAGIVDLLIWFGFLGIENIRDKSTLYSYEVRYDASRLAVPLEKKEALLVIHPAFRSALDCKV